MIANSVEPEGKSRAVDWDRITILFGQCLAAVTDNEAPYLPSQLPAFLAELLTRQSARYYDSEEALVRDAFSAWSSEGETKQSLYFDTRFDNVVEYRPRAETGNRRRPTPYEAVVESARRLRDLNEVERNIGGERSNVILGGSLSYGRFFNVVGSREGSASDLDLYIVTETYEQMRQVVEKLAGMKPAASQDVENSLIRFDNMCQHLESVGTNTPIVFSQKLALWTSGSDPILAGIEVEQSYFLSYHILSRHTSDHILLTDLPSASSIGR